MTNRVVDIGVLIVVDYYAPHVSGLTNSVRLIAEELAARGYRVTVVAGRHSRTLARRERLGGVDVRRARVWFRMGKGLVMPGLIALAARLARRAAVVNLHLPMIEAGPIALLVRRPSIVVTYHCDLELGSGLLSALQRAVVDASCRSAIASSAQTVCTTDDYARASRLRGTIARHGSVAIPPPVASTTEGTPRWRSGSGLHVGFLGRITPEKGLTYLIDAFARLTIRDARLLIGGAASDAVGRGILNSLRHRIDSDPRITVLGFIPEEDVADFYASLDLFVLPSITPLEAFGMVQLEAMTAGVPVIATDMPGTRAPVQRTGFGRLVPPRDAAALASAILDLSAELPLLAAGRDRARELYSTERVIDDYLPVFAAASRGGFGPPAPSGSRPTTR